jgi:hypothetical protein
MLSEPVSCGSCSRILKFKRYNARFGNQGYMYCDSDATLLTWSSFDPRYAVLSNDVHPWMMDAAVQRIIEESVISCPNGGHFLFGAEPRCPYCNAERPELNLEPTYFVVLGDRINGETESIWLP